jgi:hypothetical protein
MSAPLSPHETGTFAQLRGFDLALSVQTDVWESSAWRAFTERVAEKDRRGSDVIVVTCGAPVIKGNSFPSDEIGGEAVLAAARSRSVPSTVNATTAYLHSWATETIAEFHPGQPRFRIITH